MNQTEASHPRNALMFPFCAECARWLIAGRRFCALHPHMPLTTRALSGRGNIFSYTVSHAAMSTSVDDNLPYTTVLVATDEGPRILAHLEPGVRAHIGDPVEVVDLGNDARVAGTGTRVARPVPREESQS